MKKHRNSTRNKRRRRRTRRMRQKGGARSIDRIIYIFWTGDNEMPAVRKQCMDELIAQCGCKVQLVRPDNLAQYILPDSPLHEGYQYLSQVHKSDYLRCYFMHFYGGGYSDIKATTGDWNKAFDDMNANDNILINGYHEPDPGGVLGGDYPRSLWKELPGTGAFIMSPKSEFSTEWYRKMIAVMDAKLDELKKNPAKDPRARSDTQPGYPLTWTEILGDIWHPLACNYRDRFLFTTPINDFSKAWIQ